MFDRCAGLLARDASARARSATAPQVNTSPVSKGRTRSGTHPTWSLTTAVSPLAKASLTTNPQVSEEEEVTTMASLAAYAFGISVWFRKPGKRRGQPSVFAAGLWTEPRNASPRTDYASVGAQADLRFGLMHWYNLTLSIGYAVGYQGSQRAGSEWMVSLKIM